MHPLPRNRECRSSWAELDQRWWKPQPDYILESLLVPNAKLKEGTRRSPYSPMRVM